MPQEAERREGHLARLLWSPAGSPGQSLQEVEVRERGERAGAEQGRGGRPVWGGALDKNVKAQVTRETDKWDLIQVQASAQRRGEPTQGRDKRQGTSACLSSTVQGGK